MGGGLRDATEASSGHAAMNRLVTDAVELGDTQTGEYSIGLLKKKYLPRNLNPVAIALKKALKKVFDPNGILNPGKLFPD